MEELEGLGGGGELGQVQLEAGQRLLHLPRLERLVAHNVRQIVDGQVRLVSRGLEYHISSLSPYRRCEH